MITCRECGISKDDSEYYKNKRRKNGLSGVCSSCKKQKLRDYKRTQRGLIVTIYRQQIDKSRMRGHTPPEYNLSQLTEWLIGQDVFHETYNNWVNSGYKKDMIPSCDRLDNSIGYRFDNMQLVTWKENNENGRLATKQGLLPKGFGYNPVVGTNRFSGESIEFVSVSDAARKTDARRSHINECCVGKSNYSGSYTWKYKL